MIAEIAILRLQSRYTVAPLALERCSFTIHNSNIFTPGTFARKLTHYFGNNLKERSEG